jgi:Domain of Unknown Function (DUF326)
MSYNIRTTSTFHNPKYAECIEACNHCSNSCEYCGSLCLREDKVKELLKCIELCFYCADICRFASKHMSCDSSFAKEIIQYCAKVCDDCAKECGSHDMDHCKKCAVVCLECSKMCQEMATK